MKVVSFNVNSLRARLTVVLAWLAEYQPDVLCVQETKVQDVDFPTDAFERSGYKYVFKGQKSYNGVAIPIGIGSEIINVDTRCSILDTRCSILDARCSILDTRATSDESRPARLQIEFLPAATRCEKSHRGEQTQSWLAIRPYYGYAAAGEKISCLLHR